MSLKTWRHNKYKKNKTGEENREKIHISLETLKFLSSDWRANKNETNLNDIDVVTYIQKMSWFFMSGNLS